MYGHYQPHQRNFFADIVLCPWEMIKVKVQTSDPGTFPTKFLSAYDKIKTGN